MSALPCIRCGKHLENAIENDDEPELHNQPYNGTAFSTGGHYGSTVFDSFEGESIEINVCDTCLLDAAKEQRVLYYRATKKRIEFDKKFWVPDVDEERVRRIDREKHGDG